MKKTINNIITTVLIFLGIIAIYMLLLKLTNHSPTLEQINIAITGLMAGIVYKMKFHLGKITEFMENTKESIREIKEDIENLRCS